MANAQKFSAIPKANPTVLLLTRKAQYFPKTLQITSPSCYMKVYS